MKYNKSADQREKNIEKTLLVSVGAKKGEKQLVLGVLPNPKSKFPVKFIFS